MVEGEVVGSIYMLVGLLGELKGYDEFLICR